METLSEQSMNVDATRKPTDDELEHICANCNFVHPSEPYGSDFAICLHDPEFEPYIDDILDKQDLSRCQHLVSRKRFAWESKACEHFDPIDPDSEIECSSELARSFEKLAKDGDLSSDAIEKVLLEDIIERIDWKSQPVDRYVEKLEKAESSSLPRPTIRRVVGTLMCFNSSKAQGGNLPRRPSLPCWTRPSSHTASNGV